MPKFKVLAGKHADWCPEGKNPNHTYSKGDIVLTRSNLLAMNQPGAIKFELIPGSESEMPPIPAPFDRPVSNNAGTAEPSKPTSTPNRSNRN